MPRSARAQAAREPVRVLLLFGLPPEAPAVALFTQQLRRTVRNDMVAPVEFYEEYLDFDRFPGLPLQLATYFADKYRGLPIDAVVAVGSVALRFATEQLRPLRPRIPIVFSLTIDNAIDVDSLPPNVTGRFSPFSFGLILQMARRLQPDAQRVVIIGGLSAIDSFAVSSALRAVAEQASDLDITLLRGLPFDSLLAHLQRLPRQSIVLLAYFRRDGRGQLFFPGEIVSTISRESSAPLYGYSRLWVGEGIVGGSVIHHDEEGVKTGHLVTRVVQLKPNERVPRPVAARSPFVADARQLKRWGLSESRLPPNTEVLFRTPSVWERYETPILASLFLITAQSVLIALLLVERHRRRLAQLALADQNTYEQTLADLTADAMRHAPEEAPRALEDALARVARYAGASRAVIIQYSETNARPPTMLRWPHSSAATRELDDQTPRDQGELRIPLEEDGSAIGMLELYRDDVRQEWSPRLAARLEAAAELIAGAMARARAVRGMREGELLNRAVLASLSTQIAILDANGTIIRVNDSWRQRAFGGNVEVTRHAFLGQNYLDECLRAEERGCREAGDVRHGIESVLDGDAWHFRHEYNWLSPDVRWFELRVDRLDHEDGGAIITHIDITDRRQAEVKAEETRRQLTHLGRVAMVGELGAAVSHELRQPLAAIRANAEAGMQLLAKSPPDLREIGQIFREIVEDDIRAASIIDHIRLLLRKEGKGGAPISSTVDLNEICRQAVHLLKRDALLRRTRLELSLESQLTPIAGDPIQLQQVVLNLALNALDSASTSTSDPAVTVSTARRDGEIEIAVRDTGPGLAPDVERHLFESFFSTKEQGLGMGLSIVRSIVERHHGRVRAENDLTPGSAGGAVFRVLLPMS
ncbi:MAG TPA: ATP-binding protein [Gemmatimonadaceae bacterium]|nr:ATP-binding protein [Gemmatimonadaceae bacterium]